MAAWGSLRNEQPTSEPRRAKDAFAAFLSCSLPRTPDSLLDILTLHSGPHFLHIIFVNRRTSYITHSNHANIGLSPSRQSPAPPPFRARLRRLHLSRLADTLAFGLRRSALSPVFRTCLFGP